MQGDFSQNLIKRDCVPIKKSGTLFITINIFFSSNDLILTFWGHFIYNLVYASLLYVFIVIYFSKTSKRLQIQIFFLVPAFSQRDSKISGSPQEMFS